MIPVMSANHSRSSFSFFFRRFRAFLLPICLPPFHGFIIAYVHGRVNNKGGKSYRKSKIFQMDRPIMGGFVLERMTREQIEQFYQSGIWKRKRAMILRRDGYMCQLSKRYGKRVEAEVVHHIFPL